MNICTHTKIYKTHAKARQSQLTFLQKVGNCPEWSLIKAKSLGLFYSGKGERDRQTRTPADHHVMLLSVLTHSHMCTVHVRTYMYHRCVDCVKTDSKKQRVETSTSCSIGSCWSTVSLNSVAKVLLTNSLRHLSCPHNCMSLNACTSQHTLPYWICFECSLTHVYCTDMAKS